MTVGADWTFAFDLGRTVPAATLTSVPELATIPPTDAPAPVAARTKTRRNRRARSDPPKRTGEPLHDRTGRVIAEGDIVRSDEGWVWEVFRLYDYAVDPDRSLRPVVGLRPHGAPAPGQSAHTQRPPDTLEVITPAASSTGAA